MPFLKLFIALGPRYAAANLTLAEKKEFERKARIRIKSYMRMEVEIFLDQRQEDLDEAEQERLDQLEQNEQEDNNNEEETVFKLEMKKGPDNKE